jgi:hypothetical protein
MTPQIRILTDKNGNPTSAVVDKPPAGPMASVRVPVSCRLFILPKCHLSERGKW